MTVDFGYYNQCKYTRVSCGSLYRNKGTRYGTRGLELKLRLRERHRRDVSVPDLRRLLAYHHLLLLNLRGVFDLCRGRLPLMAGEEPALHLLEIGGERRTCRLRIRRLRQRHEVYPQLG